VAKHESQFMQQNWVGVEVQSEVEWDACAPVQYYLNGTEGTKWRVLSQSWTHPLNRTRLVSSSQRVPFTLQTIS
jgi:hypothetical protein